MCTLDLAITGGGVGVWVGGWGVHLSNRADASAPAPAKHKDYIMSRRITNDSNLTRLTAAALPLASVPTRLARGDRRPPLEQAVSITLDPELIVHMYTTVAMAILGSLNAKSLGNQRDPRCGGVNRLRGRRNKRKPPGASLMSPISNSDSNILPVRRLQTKYEANSPSLPKHLLCYHSSRLVVVVD
ncbi:hypothetical protein EYF80_035308 [Liparis tanakae]|uniref:Uncharacterized protein n=1 Tax=Liparis tanakae TaxID=230148 RepID=A0A4Z2GML6_9TELE|nr:hypothetical protein EYF80_035308 [Liparis tanakae]